jgi:hypothetical protein
MSLTAPAPWQPDDDEFDEAMAELETIAKAITDVADFFVGADGEQVIGSLRQLPPPAEICGEALRAITFDHGLAYTLTLISPWPRDRAARPLAAWADERAEAAA